MKYGTQHESNKYLGLALAVAAMVCTVYLMAHFCMMAVPK